MPRPSLRLGPLLVACAAAGCSFDHFGLGPAGDADGGPDGAGGADARDGDAARPDAMPCTEDIIVDAEVNGGPGPVDVLVGDSVHFSAGASCVRSGPMDLTWELSPVDGTLLTKLGGDADFTVYSLSAATYVATLTVTDGTGASQSLTFTAFRVHGFQDADPEGALADDDADVRGLAVGGGYLWMASKGDAWRMPLASPGTFEDLADTWSGDTPPADLNPVFYDASGRVWYGSNVQETRVWRGDPGSESFTEVPYDGVLGGDATVYDFVDAPTGIYMATGLGVTTSLDGDSFTGRFRPDLTAVTRAVQPAPTRTWAGGQALFDLADPAVALTPFGPGDNKLRDLALDGSSLWAASDGDCLGRLDAATGDPVAIYTAGDGAPSDTVRRLAIETSGPWAGDVWFSTDNGIGRWKQDRDIVVTLRTKAGLTTGQLSERGIVFDDSAGRAIYAGTRSALVYAHVP